MGDAEIDNEDNGNDRDDDSDGPSDDDRDHNDNVVTHAGVQLATPGKDATTMSAVTTVNMVEYVM